MSYDEFKKLKIYVVTLWDEDFSYLHNDGSKKKVEGRCFVCMREKTHIFNVLWRHMLYDGHFADNTQSDPIWYVTNRFSMCLFAFAA